MSRKNITPLQAQHAAKELQLVLKLLAAPASVKTIKDKRTPVSTSKTLLEVLRMKGAQGHAASYRVIDQERVLGPPLEAKLKQIMIKPDPDREPVPHGGTVHYPFGVDRDEYAADVLRGMHKDRRAHYTLLRKEAVRKAMEEN
jgi:hypothetical protein